MLKYCRSVLRFGKQVARIALKKICEKYPTLDGQENDNVNTIGRRFNALLHEEEDEEDKTHISEEDIRNMNLSAFAKPELPEDEIDIESILIKGDD